MVTFYSCEKSIQEVSTPYEPQGNLLKTVIEWETQLIAAQNIYAGTVTAAFNETGDQLTVTYSLITSSYCLLETHLDVQVDPANFPQTKKGNPKVGQFAYGATLNCTLGWTQVIDLTSIPGWSLGDTVFIAAHTELIMFPGGIESAWGAGLPFPGNSWAMYFYCVPEAQIASELIAYYPFNGNANDESGNYYHGINNGALLTVDRFGINDKAYNFLDDYIEIPSEALNNMPEGSVCSFITINELGQQHTILDKTITYVINYLQIIVDINNKVRVMMDIGYGSSANHVFYSSVTLNANQCYYIVVTWDSQNVKIYIDAELNSTYSCLVGVPDANRPILIGKVDNNTAYLNGSLDDIRIYNNALSLTEIEDLFSEGGWLGGV
ncbi:MAG: LamG domain-containing protein [Bacteroidia bacterium]|nr:LamG domain-containing protein [Bacteroidia bacterium]